MIFEQIKTGGDRNFGYLIGDRDKGEAVLVDPSYNPEKLLKRARVQGLTVKFVLNTHSHGDHTNGNNTVAEATGAKIAAYRESSIRPDLSLEDGSEIRAGRYALRIFFTPGHCDDHIVIYNPEFHFALTGDHLFIGKIGGTSGEGNAKQQYDNLHRLFRELPDHTTVWPGHDVGCRPSSTLALEKVCNPFIAASDFENFLRIKEQWSNIKKEQGLL